MDHPLVMDAHKAIDAIDDSIWREYTEASWNSLQQGNDVIETVEEATEILRKFDSEEAKRIVACLDTFDEYEWAAYTTYIRP
jgi:hypothetical protein